MLDINPTELADSITSAICNGNFDVAESLKKTCPTDKTEIVNKLVASELAHLLKKWVEDRKLSW